MSALTLMYLGRGLLIPLSIAALISMLLLSVCARFEKMGMNRVFAAVISIILAILAVAILFFFLGREIASLANDLPSLKGAVDGKLQGLHEWVEKVTGISPGEQVEWLKKRSGSAMESGGTMITSTLSATGNALAQIAPIPIYIFFFLLYRDKFKRFMDKIASNKNLDKTDRMVSSIRKVTKSYLTGVFLVILILAAMNSIGLMLIGIDHAIFLGCFAALLNIIPYIGVLIGSILAVLMALVTKDSAGYAVAVFGLFTFNQFIENNFLTPNITGGKVSVNPLATIIALIIGGSIWGVAGMIIFIPLLGIVKVICDNVESLRPLGYLIGDEGTEELEMKKPKWLKRLRRDDDRPLSSKPSGVKL